MRPVCVLKLTFSPEFEGGHTGWVRGGERGARAATGKPGGPCSTSKSFSCSRTRAACRYCRDRRPLRPGAPRPSGADGGYLAGALGRGRRRPGRRRAAGSPSRRHDLAPRVLGDRAEEAPRVGAASPEPTRPPGALREPPVARPLVPAHPWVSSWVESSQMSPPEEARMTTGL